jgi:chaperonin GroEL (HSP60 family)
MLKMLLDPMGGIVLTNDGNAILREVSDIILNEAHYKWFSFLDLLIFG